MSDEILNDGTGVPEVVPTQDTAPATGWDTTDTETGVSAPASVTSTIIIVP